MMIGSVQKLKSGTSKLKDGRKIDWTISEVQATSLDTGKSGKFSTFDDFAGREAQEVEVDIWQEEHTVNGQTYKNWKMAWPKRSVWQELNQLRADVDKLQKAVFSEEKSIEAEMLEDEPMSTADGSALNVEDLQF